MTAPSSVKPSQLPVTGVKTPPAGGPTLGLAEAAKACGVSVSTLRRKRPELAALGAAQTATGWRIPITALIALGLMDRTTGGRHDGQHDTPMTPTTTAPVDALTAPVDALTAQLDALRTALADAERRAVAEAVAAERERMIQTQAMALRMLEASKPPATPTPTITTQPAESPSPAPSKEDPQDAPKRPWWRRR